MCSVMSSIGGDRKTRSSHRKTVKGSVIMSDWLRRGSKLRMVLEGKEEEEDDDRGRRRELRSPFTVITCKCLDDEGSMHKATRIEFAYILTVWC